MSSAEFAAWESQQREELQRRGEGMELHPMELIKVSTPNTGSGFGIEEGRFVRIQTQQQIVAYDISLRLPRIEKPWPSPYSPRSSAMPAMREMASLTF